MSAYQRFTTIMRGEHPLTVPDHEALRVGMLAAILGSVAEHFDLQRDEVITRLFGRS